MGVIRQGDVALVRVRAIPKGAIEQKIEGEKLILALGEATGHHHRFEFMDMTHNVKLYVGAGGERYLDVAEPAELKHEEHAPACIPAGSWLLPQQVEYRPEALRRVQD